MVVRLSNNLRGIRRRTALPPRSYVEALKEKNHLSLSTKLLAWGLFLIFFIENGTLGLIPKQYYFVYRNVRISDMLLYALVIYSFYSINDFKELFSSSLIIIPKIILIYFGVQYIVSAILYEYNPLELFFRLKGLWMSLLLFPFLLLLKKRGLGYLIKLILPVAIVSNILYVLSSLTGTAFLPDIGISEQHLPGGLKVYRVFGGTFYGEVFFLGFIYIWLTKKFKLYQLILTVLFILPHILAFGRSAWTYFAITIFIMLIWNAMKKKDFRTAVRQVLLITVLGIALIYSFNEIIPQSEYMFEALEARVEQGQEDWKYNEGTLGSRLANTTALLSLWSNNNIFFGIGMHPMWVIKPLTAEESIYAWGFSDVIWASVLAAYGLIGFTLAVIFQIYYLIKSFVMAKNTVHNDILIFFVIVFFSRLFFDSVVSYSYKGISSGLYGFWPVTFYLSALIYKFTYPDEEYNL